METLLFFIQKSVSSGGAWISSGHFVTVKGHTQCAEVSRPKCLQIPLLPSLTSLIQIATKYPGSPFKVSFVTSPSQDDYHLLLVFHDSDFSSGPFFCSPLSVSLSVSLTWFASHNSILLDLLFPPLKRSPYSFSTKLMFSVRNQREGLFSLWIFY